MHRSNRATTTLAGASASPNASTSPNDEEFDLDADRLREECGVFGIFGHPDAAAITALGLHALQHRGQEACGIASFDGQRFHTERHMGHVAEAFSSPDVVDRLPGALLEEKEYSLAWHYRRADLDQASLRAKELLDDLTGFDDGPDGGDLDAGRRHVLEGWHVGSLASWCGR